MFSKNSPAYRRGLTFPPLQTDKRKKAKMFLILALVLMVVWLGLFVGLHVTSFLIHLLLIFALISVVMHFVGGAKSTA
jgi:Flp pilus assembly protein TadB